MPAGSIEPKWDGFRCLAFRAGDEVEIKAKSGKSLSRFFPEVLENLRAARRQDLCAGRGTRHSGRWRALLRRAANAAASGREPDRPAFRRDTGNLHRLRLPAAQGAASRCWQSRSRNGGPRWRNSSKALARTFGAVDHALHPRTSARPKKWLGDRQVSVDGVVAKRLDLPYQPGERAMLKIKNLRTADCVVGGFRYEAGRKLVGSLLLGLYDEQGLLHHVGFTSALADSEKPALTKRLEKLVAPPGFTGDAPGGPSRWSTARSAEWQAASPQARGRSAL